MSQIRTAFATLTLMFMFFSRITASAMSPLPPLQECLSANVQYRAFLIKSVEQQLVLSDAFQQRLIYMIRTSSEVEDATINLERVSLRIKNQVERLQDLTLVQRKCSGGISPSL